MNKNEYEKTNKLADRIPGNLSAKNVEPNIHDIQAICDHLITGSYVHQNENGEWVPGPAVSYHSKPGYAWLGDVKSTLSKFLHSICNKLIIKGETMNTKHKNYNRINNYRSSICCYLQ